MKSFLHTLKAANKIGKILHHKSSQVELEVLVCILDRISESENNILKIEIEIV